MDYQNKKFFNNYFNETLLYLIIKIKRLNIQFTTENPKTFKTKIWKIKRKKNPAHKWR